MSDFLALPFPNGFFFASASLNPCSETMHQTSRVSRSMTLSASAKYFGSRVYAALTTPAPSPRSHCSSDTCLGPRCCFQRSSPRAAQSSAGLPSCSAARYLAISSTAEPCANAAGIASTLSSKTSHEPRREKSDMSVLSGLEGNGSARHRIRRARYAWSGVTRDAGGCAVDQAIVASSVRLSPRLSTQVMVTFSPFAPPLNLKDRKGFFATAGPHCAASTVLPPYVTVTLWMNHAGMTTPCASLR